MSRSGALGGLGALALAPLAVAMALALTLLAGCGKAARTAAANASPAPGGTATAVASAAASATAVAAGASPSTAGFPMAITDALGSELVLGKPARRVVSLSPNLTELVCYIGGVNQLVGITDFCDYPPAALGKTRVGGIINPSFERILALKPDLVLVARGTDLTLIRRLRKTGVQVYASDPQSLEEVLDLMRDLGKMLGREAEARKAADALCDRMGNLEEAAAKMGANKHPRALLVVELDPLFIPGPGTFLQDLLTEAGFRNAAGGIKRWARWSSERLLYSNPDLIILVKGHTGTGGQAPGVDMAQRLAHRTPWSRLAAVKAGHVYTVKDDLVTIPGPRLVDGLAELVKIRREYFQSLAAKGQSQPADAQ